MSLHVLPIDDLEAHEESSACKCRPRVEVKNGEMIIIHNSFDGREKHEAYWIQRAEHYLRGKSN